MKQPIPLQNFLICREMTTPPFKQAADVCQDIEDKLRRVQPSKHIEHKRAIGRRKQEEEA